MIHAYGAPHAPVPRLIEALAQRGHRLARDQGAPDAHSTLVLGPGIVPNPMALGTLLGAWRRTPGARVLVLSLLGVHPDTQGTRLRDLWDLEEQVRSAGLPTLVLRLAPLVGPESPLWLKLRGRPRLHRTDRQLIQPLVELDAIETLDRALQGAVRWQGWYELAGPDALTLGELAAMAADSGPPVPSGIGAWEPPLDEMREHRLAEPDAWLEHFGMTVSRVGDTAGSWRA